MEPLESYLSLRAEVDALVKRLVERHGTAIACAPGCCDCCVDLSVFPVEFFAISLAMTQRGFDVRRAVAPREGSCRFLAGGRCRIYPYRPIICRTHGVPVAFVSETGDPALHEVSFCERNFQGVHPEHLVFDEENTLDLDRLNLSLSAIDLSFRAAFGERTLPGRIPLTELVEDPHG